MKKFTIEDKLFKTEPLFIYNCSYGELVKYLVRQGIEEEKIHNGFTSERMLGTATVMHFDKFPYRVVWFNKVDIKNPNSLGEIAHELLHLVIRICEDKGIPIKANFEDGYCADEPIAYMIDYFYTEFIKKVRRLK